MAGGELGSKSKSWAKTSCVLQKEVREQAWRCLIPMGHDRSSEDAMDWCS